MVEAADDPGSADVRPLGAERGRPGESGSGLNLLFCALRCHQTPSYPLKRLRVARARTQCFRSANHANYTMSVYPTLSPANIFADQ